MKEKPILFSGEMVRAILDGSKIQTRRVIKPQPRPGFGWPFHDPEEHIVGHFWFSDGDADDGFFVKSPFIPDDRLWVRETYCNICAGAPCLRADIGDICPISANPARWKASIHMPRKSSRITLEVVNVRVERLRDISDDDIQKEGVKEMRISLIEKYEKKWEPQCWLRSEPAFSYCRKCAEDALRKSAEKNDLVCGGYPGASLKDEVFNYCEICGKLLETVPHNKYATHELSDEELAMCAYFNIDDQEIDKEIFRRFWDKLNAKRPGCLWDDNPWVWVIEFRRLAL